MGKQSTIQKAEALKQISDQSISENGSSISKIETIRNLIFGENIETYNSEFETMKSDILKKKQLLEDLVEEVRSDLKSAIDNVAIDVNIRITELEDKMEEKIERLESEQVKKSQLGKLLVTLGEKIREA